MGRKIINIKHAGIDKHKPLVAMSHREREEAFHDLGGPILEGMMDDARALDGPGRVRLVAVALSSSSAPDRIVVAYEEYGDEENVGLCEELAGQHKPYLHAGESLRVTTYEIDLERAKQIKFPSKKTWQARDSGNARAAQAYGRLHDVRGLVTVAVIWLVGVHDRRIVMWNVDHGDGCGVEDATDTIDGIKWNKLLAERERLELIVYAVPMDALSEVVRPKA